MCVACGQVLLPQGHTPSQITAGMQEGVIHALCRWERVARCSLPLREGERSIGYLCPYCSPPHSAVIVAGAWSGRTCMMGQRVLPIDRPEGLRYPRPYLNHASFRKGVNMALALAYKVRSYSTGTLGRAICNARTHHFVADDRW